MTTRLVAAGALIAFLGGLSVIVLSGSRGNGIRVQTVPLATTETTPGPTPAPAPRVRIAVTGVGAYDPDGDRSENDGEAVLATDGKPATAWKSERYRGTFSKTGVGLVVDAGKPVKASRAVVSSETPGYDAEIRVGDSPAGPFVAVSKTQVTRERTIFVLRPRPARYLMVWITSMPPGGAAAVNEITVTGEG